MEKSITTHTNEVSLFIEQAIKQNLPVETMEKLFALHKEVQKEYARAEFVKAMAGFQAECPVIEKKKDVKDYSGNVRYSYATLDTIVSQVKELLGKYNLSYTIQAKFEGEIVSATCKITHIQGHSEESSFSAPIQDQKNKSGQSVMTKPQQFASALTFAKRYAFCNALGILTGDEDKDATDVKDEPKAKSPKSRIVFALRQLGLDTTGWDQLTWSNTIQEKVGLALIDANLPEIADRLEVLVTEKNHDNSEI